MGKPISHPFIGYAVYNTKRKTLIMNFDGDEAFVWDDRGEAEKYCDTETGDEVRRVRVTLLD